MSNTTLSGTGTFSRQLIGTLASSGKIQQNKIDESLLPDEYVFSLYIHTLKVICNNCKRPNLFTFAMYDTLCGYCNAKIIDKEDIQCVQTYILLGEQGYIKTRLKFYNRQECQNLIDIAEFNKLKSI